MSPTLPEMHCDEFVEQVTDYLEGALSARDHARLEEHLAACGKCAGYLAQLRRITALTGQLTEHDVTPAMRGDLMDVFARWSAERAAAAAGTEPRADGDEPSADAPPDP